SMIWGSAALPVSDQDLADWPINHDDLAPYYRKVLQTMPLCGGDGTLEDAFPSLSPSLDELYQGAQGRNLLRDLERSKEWLRTRGVLYGPARLAIHTTESTSSMGCNSCGFCLSGCPRNAIFNTLGVLDEICGEGKVEYRNNSIVHRVDEQDTGVTVTIIDEPTGRQSVETFDAVFLGAGAINTTRILLTSRELYERTITLKESKKFLLPLLRFKSDTEAMTERQVTLANIFMEINIPALSKHWIHMQMSPMNDLIMKSFGLAPDAPSSLRRTILSPILQRFMVAWCGLHSDHGDKFEIKLARSGAYEPPILYVRSKPNLDGRRVAWRIARKLIGIGLRTRTIFVPYPLFTEPSRGTHCGGAFPMRDKPTDLLDSDILGRPFGWKRVYAVDSSVFPSIPGTTIAFNIMANAYRIGTNAPL
ncbi:MAG: GMC family oxidoreductase, partial [Rhodospirillales bacterium]|nr:GMC family oxidoreductase [Rhodospirillales bacterium]